MPRKRKIATPQETEDLANVAKNIWRESIGEADVRFYLMQSVLSEQSDCQWLSRNLECGLYRYFYNQVDLSDSESCFLMHTDPSQLAQIQEEQLHLQLDPKCTPKYQQQWKQFVKNQKLTTLSVTVDSLVKVYQKLAQKKDLTLLNHWMVVKKYITHWEQRLDNCITSWMSGSTSLDDCNIYNLEYQC